MTETKAPPAVPAIERRGYANPEVLVSTEWVAAHLDDPAVRLVESDEDLLLYETGHIPGAVKIDWVGDLNDPLTRDYLQHEPMQRLLRARGINQGTTIVLYGDKNNWWATYAFWVFRLFGLTRLRLMDGGRARWIDEGRPITVETPKYPAGDIVVGERDDAGIRVFRDDVIARRNTAASGCTCQTIPTRARCAEATFRERRAFPGPAR
jgi:thiosulfate/3-mercaptopyruvate sulfurtransferase